MPPIRILLFNWDTNIWSDVCFHTIIELINDNSGKHDIIIPISSLSLPINTIIDINKNVTINLHSKSMFVIVLLILKFSFLNVYIYLCMLFLVIIYFFNKFI